MDLEGDLYVPEQTIDRIHHVKIANTENGLFKFIDNLESFWLQLSTGVKNVGMRHEIEFEPITLNEFYYPLVIYFCHLMGIALIFILEIIWFRFQSRRQRFHIQLKNFGRFIWRPFANFNKLHNRCKRFLTIQNLRNLFQK